LLSVLLVFLVAVALAGLARWREGRASYVARVLDGDTLLMGTGETIRLIGVDAPETDGPYTRAEPLGEPAAAFARRLAEGRRVRLEFDRERRDRHGRTLAYVFVGAVHLNAALLHEGYARAYRRFPHRRLEEFLTLEREARAARRGIWGVVGQEPATRRAPRRRAPRRLGGSLLRSTPERRLQR
jgi:micrococcal nuclease